MPRWKGSGLFLLLLSPPPPPPPAPPSHLVFLFPSLPTPTPPYMCTCIHTHHNTYAYSQSHIRHCIYYLTCAFYQIWFNISAIINYFLKRTSILTNLNREYIRVLNRVTLWSMLLCLYETFRQSSKVPCWSILLDILSWKGANTPHKHCYKWTQPSLLACQILILISIFFEEVGSMVESVIRTPPIESTYILFAANRGKFSTTEEIAWYWLCSTGNW